jgi:hypothetical protein
MFSRIWSEEFGLCVPIKANQENLLKQVTETATLLPGLFFYHEDGRNKFSFNGLEGITYQKIQTSLIGLLDQYNSCNQDLMKNTFQSFSS